MKKFITTFLLLLSQIVRATHCLANDRYGRPSDLPGYHGGDDGWTTLIVLIIMGYIIYKMDDSKGR